MTDDELFAGDLPPWPAEPAPCRGGGSAADANASDPLATSEDGAQLLDEVRGLLARFVAFPSEAAAVAVALWAAHAHLVYAGDNSPRLALLSPEPGSGKTRTLEVLELLVPAPMAVLSASAAAVFRSIDAEHPTLLLDEVDALFGRRGSDDGAEDLRGLLNPGHRKGASIPRCVGPTHQVTRFPTFAAVALAGLGDLPDTLMSRSVIVRMRRRAPGEKVEPFRRRLHAAEGEALRGRLASWAETTSAAVGSAWPEMPEGVEDRPADVWEPLLAIADAAGGTWPTRARSACVELCKVAASRDASLGVRLLADLRDVFTVRAADGAVDLADALATETILDRLHAMDEAPWSDLRGKPLDSRGLARRLHQYEVSSIKVKVDGKALKGYRREHLWDAWTRYLPAVPQEGEPGEPKEPGRSEAMPEVPHAERLGNRGNPWGTSRDAWTCDVPQVPQVPLPGAGCAVPYPHEALDSESAPLYPCPHGVEDGAAPDDWLGGRLKCPQCRLAEATP